MPAIPLRSFAGGEIGPELAARADQVKYQTGLAECFNCIVQRYGSVVNRPGTTFLAEVEDSARTTRLIPFIFNDEQTYALEFGHLVMRVYRDGALLGAPYELVTPYTEDEVWGLQYEQIGDAIYLATTDHSVHKLTRSGHTSWAIAAVDFLPNQDPPASSSVVAGAAGANTYRYKVTAISADNDEESVPAYGAVYPQFITNISQANPAVVTIAAHGMDTGDLFRIDEAAAMGAQLEGRAFTITRIDANNFSLDGEDTTAQPSPGTGYGIALQASVRLAATPTAATPNVISWPAATGAREYNVYKQDVNGVYGFIGISEGLSFSDINFAPVATDQPPNPENPFIEEIAGLGSISKPPGVVGSYQQRMVYAATEDEPAKVWASQTGNLENMTKSTPLVSSDALKFTVLGGRVYQVRHILDLGTLVLLTAGAEYTAGDGDGALTPTAINLRRQSGYGAATVKPVVIGETALYVQARQSIIRDLRYQVDPSGRTGVGGNDLTVYAPHLFEGYDIVEMAFAQNPHAVLWCVRSDGVLLGLTYLREHDVWAWHRHETDGVVESVCVIPEGREDAVYLLIRRTIDGASVRYVERMDTRTFTEVRFGRFLDCAIGYDGRNLTGTTLTLTGGTTWAAGEELTLTASTGIFVAGDVGNAYDLTAGDETVRVTVLAYTSTTVVTVEADSPVPVGLRAVAVTAWAKAVDELTGLDHLIGCTVGILADGNVLPEQVVSAAGELTLPSVAAIIQVGLPYVSRMKTLDLEDPNAGTLVGRKKRIAKARVLVRNTRGLWAGTGTGTLDEQHLDVAEEYNQELGVYTGTLEVDWPSSYEGAATVTIEQRDPLPMQVLGIVPQLDLGKD